MCKCASPFLSICFKRCFGYLIVAPKNGTTTPPTSSLGMMLEVSECVWSMCDMRWTKPHLDWWCVEALHLLGLWYWHTQELGNTKYIDIGFKIFNIEMISIEALIVRPTLCIIQVRRSPQYNTLHHCCRRDLRVLNRTLWDHWYDVLGTRCM
jgi:hypothetical protein